MSEYKIFVASLAYGATDRDLYEIFDKYGQVKDAKVCTDSATGRAKGFGFVEYDNYEDMKAALRGADGAEVLGRPIVCERAKSRGGGGGSRDRDGGRDRGGRDRDRYSGQRRDRSRDRDDDRYSSQRRSSERYSSRDDRRDRSRSRDRRR